MLVPVIVFSLFPPPPSVFPVCICEELWQFQLRGPLSNMPLPPALAAGPFCAKYQQLRPSGSLSDPLSSFTLQWAPTAVCTICTLSWQPVCASVQNFGNFSSQAHFLTPPAVGPNTSVYVLDTADMGHAEPDGSNEWEDDHNQRLYNAPGWSCTYTWTDCQASFSIIADSNT